MLEDKKVVRRYKMPRKTLIEANIDVKGTNIGVTRINNQEYISLTDLARSVNPESPADVVKNWLRNKETISFLGIWEELNNKNFKVVEFDQFKNEAGRNAFTMSPQKWIRETNAIGMVSKSGKYGGGTFAQADIAFQFASWISPEIKLYLIKEFERLKANESYQNSIDWNESRLLSKINYRIHTDAIKNTIIPTLLTDRQKSLIYPLEADVLNVAIFGMTSKQWKEKNPQLKGNQRDYADSRQLLVLNNIENINAILIKDNLLQKERLTKLNKIAIEQLKILEDDKSLDFKLNEIEKIEEFNKKQTTLK